ncbi:MAG: hypothetical protein ACI4UV_12810 [Victivallales bacterium]
MRFLLTSLICIITVWLFAGTDTVQPARKKLIDLSWNNPTVDFLEKHLEEMEKNTPLDGIVIRLWGKPEIVNGKKIIPGRMIWGKIPIKYESFKSTIEKYKRLKFKKFTDNFFYYTVSPGDADWFSDADWKSVTNNAKVMAKVAKVCGLKGFLLDIEEYGSKFWNYNLLKTDKDYDEACKKAFQRGQEWGDAVFGEFPDIVVFMPFMFTFRSGALNEALLCNPFINGIIDVMPPQARLLEGHENFSYQSKKPSDYAAMRHQFDRHISRMAIPENREKFRHQVQLAPGFYIDAIFAPEARNKRWNNELKPEINTLGSLVFFQRNLAAALLETEEYIWLYNERGCWWSKSQSINRHAKKTWEETAPGVTAAIMEVKYPALMSMNDNMVKNGDFKQGLEHWTLWQMEYDLKKSAPGIGRIVDSRCTLSKLTNGCFKQTVEVKPGDFMFFRVQGGYGKMPFGYASAGIAFQDASGKWHNGMNSLSLRIPKTDRLETVSTCFTVPENACKIVVLLSAACQGKSGEAYFKSVLLRKM